jgi:predicted regulator of Ras-like GTPase activity (Roadblock/LC7/MglB family)
MNVDLAELDDRIAKCQKILEADPNSQIFAALAEAYRKKGEVSKALEVCRKGIEMHPDYASAYIVLAKVFADQNNFNEADRQLQKAIEVGGRTRSVDLLQSEIYIKLGYKDKARNILFKLQKSDPHNDVIKNLLVALESKSIDMPEPAPAPKFKSEIARMPKSEHITVPKFEPEPIPPPPAVKRSYTLSNALSIIKVLPRVLGVVAVGRDGIVIEGHFDGMLSRDELGALASGAYDSIALNIAKINLGQPGEILIESEHAKLWLYYRNNMIIVVSMRDDVNLGSLRLKVSEIFKNTEF